MGIGTATPEMIRSQATRFRSPEPCAMETSSDGGRTSSHHRCGRSRSVRFEKALQDHGPSPRWRPRGRLADRGTASVTWIHD